MLRGDILGFADVVRQVEELAVGNRFQAILSPRSTTTEPGWHGEVVASPVTP
jgi:hypothetical protein